MAGPNLFVSRQCPFFLLAARMRALGWHAFVLGTTYWICDKKYGTATLWSHHLTLSLKQIGLTPPVLPDGLPPASTPAKRDGVGIVLLRAQFFGTSLRQGRLCHHRW